MTRRQALKTAAVASAAWATLSSIRVSGAPAERGPATASGPFSLPPLPYAFNALEPSIDARTMEIHHGKHHKAYVDNANKALEGTKWAEMDPVEVIKPLGDLPEDKRTAVRNNAGGHLNHSMFWKLMAPAGKGGGGEPTGDVA